MSHLEKMIKKKAAAARRPRRSRRSRRSRRPLWDYSNPHPAQRHREQTRPHLGRRKVLRRTPRQVLR